jgi:glycosyltransferase involved in cell wall biosynthesis
MVAGMPPIVSVVIPTFNRSLLVLRALESVFAQTFTDYEVIVIDDGSTDDTREKLEPYLERIRYFQQANRGAAAAQNQGIMQARGRWVAILASDDEWLPTKLERQIEAVNRFPVDACFTDCSIMPGGRTAFQMAGFEPGQTADILRDPIHHIFARKPIIWMQSLMVCRRCLYRAGLFDEAMTVSEDADLLFRLAEVTEFAFIAEPLVRIDSSPCRSDRLMRLFEQGDDRAFRSRIHMYQKWLKMIEAAGSI